ncbi:hypothetical protein ABER02_11255 [Rossellomorea marisflavi]|uniref:hypothetical protein n=1 Tax=Rossellomorea marisflavi TaxID=189381 RepID=UPI003D2B18C1
MTLSRWTDNTENSMEDIINNMLNYEEWRTPEVDHFNDEILNYRVIKAFEENKVITLNDTNIFYNYITYEYEKVRAGEETNEMRSQRVYPLSGYIIVYSDGINTQYITNRSGSSNTLTILRKLNNYNGRLEVTHQPLRINEDIFTWLIFKVLNSAGDSLEDDSRLIIEKIIGFKGATNDRLAEVKGTGNRIMNILSTLAFLFENETVSYIKPRVIYNNDTIEFSMDLIGTIDIDLETYTGDYMMDPETERESKIILKTFLEIIPKLLTAYHNDSVNEDWSPERKREFFTQIGATIQEKINEKINE